MTPSTEIALFAVLGLLGGFVHVFIDSKAWSGLLKFESVKQTIVGGFAGGLYWFLYAEHNYPDKMMAFVVGYSGTDFIIKLIGRMTEKEIKDEQ